MSIKRETKGYLKNQNFIPSKRMGQNFLVDESILDLIQASIDYKKIDVIIEVGPGLGALTDKLLEFKNPLYLIELDKRLFANLKEKYKSNQMITTINDDVIRYDLNLIIEKYKNPCIITNLPYSISSLMVLKFLKEQEIRTMYCMLQKEFGDKLLAKHKTSDFNSMSCIFQHYAKAKLLFDVPNTSFDPIPKVQSVFLKIEKINNEKFNQEYSKYLKNIFLAKRKTFTNNLKYLFSKEKIDAMYKHFKLNSNVRSEEISESNHFKIFKFLSKE